MKSLRIYETRIEIYPYRLGEYPELERVCSTKYDSARHKRYPIGYHYEKETQTLMIPRGISIAWLSQFTGSYPTYYHPTKEAKMKYQYKVTAKPRNEEQTKVLLFLMGLGDFSQYKKYAQVSLNVEAGFGKTYCTVVAALERCMRTIIIVHSNKIKDQWLDTILTKTTVKPERILDLSGSMNMHKLLKEEVDYDIIITLQSSMESYISKYGYYGMREFMDHLECGTKIIDEAHLYFKSTLQIDFCSNISKNYYLTATFTRSNRLESDLFALSFSNAIRYGAELKKTKNVVYTFVYYNSNPSDVDITSIKTAYGPNNYRFIDYAIKRDPNCTFLAAFFHTLELAKQHEGKTLIIVPKIETCELLSTIIHQEYPDDKIGTFHSKHTEEENKRIEEESDIIISTIGSMGTGSDTSGLRNMIICDLFSSAVTCHQLPKRLRPLENGEDSYCYELVDTGFESILNMVRRKTKYIKEIAKKIKKIEF